VVASVIGGRFHEGAPGLEAGARGGTGEIAVNDGPPLGKSSQVMLAHGDRIRMRFPGGGGFGDPHERAPQAVLADVRRGFVTPQRASEDYGVALRADAREIDAAQTARLRGNARG
jgi:N-methylhydantoinase B